MIAIEIQSPGGPEVLVPVERPVPSIGPGDVLIKVAAAGVNRPDVMQRQGRYPPPPGVTDIPGLEVAGHDRAGRSGSDGLARRRPRVRARVRRRLRGILRRAGAAVPADPARTRFHRTPPRSLRRRSRSGRTCSSAGGCGRASRS